MSDATDTTLGVVAGRAEFLPRYEAGWMARHEGGECVGYTAFLRPYSEDWYDVEHFARWWDALACAVDLARVTPDCLYIGGPGAEQR